ncbi:zinc finger BED domain-containing protein DAYSLEEPER-like protein [Tanacetum coccineum]
MSKRSVPQLSIEMEFDRYLEGLEPRSPDFDILLWEKLRGAKYPVMQAIARDTLAIPVSSIASESAFSTSGRLISPHRSQLRPDTIEALMYEGTPFTSYNNATIFDDYDTDGEGEGEGKSEDQVRTKVFTISGIVICFAALHYYIVLGLIKVINSVRRDVAA